MGVMVDRSQPVSHQTFGPPEAGPSRGGGSLGSPWCRARPTLETTGVEEVGQRGVRPILSSPKRFLPEVPAARQPYVVMAGHTRPRHPICRSFLPPFPFHARIQHSKQFLGGFANLRKRVMRTPLFLGLPRKSSDGVTLPRQKYSAA